MNSLHQVSITGPSGAPPETAAIRFLSLLPDGWRAEVGEFQENRARLRIEAPPGTTTSEATRTATDILSQPGLQGWHLADE
ncbi:hypothetical protein [Streptomyces purpurascens]|uniref:Uncharacterized protein n=1 Tax=Streptomyces purpurascens TaxID=1924 RepID=A0ABZ1MNI5_STREF|nr:hypothetical protein [Streptomyces purpurascens]MCE7048114.1 hypothetical protein [Streptomyces purpurascens]GHA29478.1 hypothetical protein GCM10010303_45120 [Streptomyces purpurascens]